MEVKWHFNQPGGDFNWPTWGFNQARCDVVTFEDDRTLAKHFWIEPIPLGSQKSKQDFFQLDEPKVVSWARL